MTNTDLKCSKLCMYCWKCLRHFTDTISLQHFYCPYPFSFQEPHALEQRACKVYQHVQWLKWLQTVNQICKGWNHHRHPTKKKSFSFTRSAFKSQQLAKNGKILLPLGDQGELLCTQDLIFSMNPHQTEENSIMTIYVCKKRKTEKE